MRDKIRNKIKSINRNIEYHRNVTIRNNKTSYRIIRGLADSSNIKIIGMIRLRDEELVLRDTLDHMSKFVDGIVVFDDASTDNSVEIARKHPKVLEIIVNKKWRGSSRAWEETANRTLLYVKSRKYNPDWFFYADADERFEGDIRDYLLNQCPDDVSAIKISLFDAYITEDDQNGCDNNSKLYNFRKYFGIEQRNIMMIWRSRNSIAFKKPDLREPQGVVGKVIVKFYCQHYGKSLSIDHWEETCDYYVNNFPKYSEKWKARKGHAIHKLSDFGTPLYLWDKVKEEGVVIN